jgi:riboflavin transporter FmnP
MLIALFAALAVVLNGLTVPAPYAGFLLYGIWEIPVLLSLLLLGFWGGATVALINAIALEFINPGGLPTGPLYNLFAELSMFLGVMAIQAVARRGSWRFPVTVVGATAGGIALRVGVMTIVNDLVLAQPYPIGFGTFGVTQAAVPGLLVVIGIFNATTALYVIPAAYSIRRAISARYPSFGGETMKALTP